MSENADALTDRFALEIFVAAGCPNCPQMVSAANALSAGNPNVSVQVLDATEHADRASRYEVRSVPTTVVNGDLTIIGVLKQAELVQRLLDLQGPEAENAILKSLVNSGRINDATSRLLDGKGTEGFAELWNESVLEKRIGLSLVAQNAVEERHDALDSLVDLILPSLDSEDAALRGDTADLLGVIAHERARPALEKLLKDDLEDVAEAAADALESIDERSAE